MHKLFYKLKIQKKLLILIFLPLLGACQPALVQKTEVNSTAQLSQNNAVEDPPEVKLGERLFKETRFAQYFFAHFNGQTNDSLIEGDAVLFNSETLSRPLPGPFRNLSMNCAACHQVDQSAHLLGGGMRTYADFARRSPIPAREEDHLTHTLRNSPALVEAMSTRDHPLFLHFDGEFSSAEDLVKGSFTSRNFGWLVGEKNTAIAHIAKIIREDNGRGLLAQEFGSYSYSQVFKSDDQVLAAYKLPLSFRIDVEHSSDEQILDAVAHCVAAYLKQLEFNKNEQSEFISSPYDVFIHKNALPAKPHNGESLQAYNQRLLLLLENLQNPIWVNSEDGRFRFHEQEFKFNQEELDGLKIFLKTKNTDLTEREIREGKIGNCASCHQAPAFTDFKFHNSGVSQDEYERIHGENSFLTLNIPSFAERNASPQNYLSATFSHPNYHGHFSSIPSAEVNDAVDLGLWSVFAHPDHDSIQNLLKQILCPEFNLNESACENEVLLPLTIALFKTPSLRDLGHSAPYFHNGFFDDLDTAVQFYQSVSDRARDHKVRNADPALARISITAEDRQQIVQFLKSLNEDYE